MSPTVSQTTPTRGAVGVSTRTTVTITFSESMDPATIHFATFQVSAGDNPVEGRVVGLGRRFTFDPESDLPAGQIEVVIEGAADAAGNRMATPYAFEFSTGAGPPPPPQPSNPFPGQSAINVPREPTFTWEGGSGNTFDFLLGTNPLTMTERATGLTTESFSAGPLPYLTTHFWQVIAHSPGGETQGPIWSFMTEADPNPGNRPPDEPCNPQPPDNALSVPRGVSLSWGCLDDPDGDDVSYEVYLGIGPNPPLQAVVAAPPYTPAQLLSENEHYRWRIVADDGHGGRTSSDVWSFRTAQGNNPPSAPAPPITPPNGSTTDDNTVNLSWSGGDDVDGDDVTYEVRLGTVNPPPPSANIVSSKNYLAQDLAFETIYFWQIVARDDRAGQTPGPVWQFTTPQEPPPPNRPPTQPCSPQPANGAQNVTATVTLTWGCGDDPDGDAVEYDVYFEKNDSDPDHIVATVNEKSYAVSNLDPEANYFWKIVARDENDAETAGAVWSFTTQSRPPTAPCSPDPEDGEFFVSPSNVVLEWGCGQDPDGGTVTFDIYFGNTPDPPLVESGWTEREYPAGGLDILARYYWKIVAHDADGQTAGPVWSFQTGVANE